MKEYAELPWSVEDTIENLKSVKDSMKERVILLNLHGRGKKDAEEVEFDFGRAIDALERNQPKQVTDIQVDKLRFGTCPICKRRISTVEGGNYCQNCGQRIDWSE